MTSVRSLPHKQGKFDRIPVMTLDYTKTATPCELITHLIPAIQGNLWSPALRWHGRQQDGTWKQGQQDGRHLHVLSEAVKTLPTSKRWNRFHYILAFQAGQYQALRWLKKASEKGVLERPDDFPTLDRFNIREELGCVCGQGCWEVKPFPSEPAFDLSGTPAEVRARFQDHVARKAWREAFFAKLAS
jgi:hypothetical protein